jgi:soluble lytic murein transglycosylase-like protein
VNANRAFSRTDSPSGSRARFEKSIRRFCQRYHVDQNLVRAIIANESSWKTGARSKAGAIGLMQLMPGTAEMLGIDPTNPEQNIEGGIRYLAGLLRMFKGDVDAALVAYNAGPAHAQKWRRGYTVLYGETQTYLQRVKHSYENLLF